MISSYRIEAGKLAPSEKDQANIFVYIQPTEAEKEDLLGMFALDPLDMEAIYDPD
jgi:hypothetical protein